MTDPTEISSIPEEAILRKPRRGLSFSGRLRAYFLAGVLVTAPISLTIYIAWLLIDFIDSQVTPLIPLAYHPETYLPFTIPGLGVLVLIMVITLIGAITAGFLGRLLIRAGEAIVNRVPVIRGVYGALKQIMETVLAQKSDAFRQVVLVEYPRKDCWVLAFVSGGTTGEVQSKTAADLVNVFVPTTPNPTSGFLLFVPAKDMIYLDMTIEEGIKMVVSGGIVTPTWPRAQTAEEGLLPIAVRNDGADQPERR
ncbi:MAG: DUF502 domain-containing protein [Alphaproteobacteria bacterium]|nr:DUF502 domain-containing protein [Alphaproteobacteria bacterium]MBU0797081.1 DUF502 domain-containing protein [Alphaproteobacteria bacterium]MBU0887888.1 DUF502 domain-containing protein [Alphaproteobacteria bacterium]MBU1814889.1 DUF502 domain-containing protein [Alphaproteobacteria bacterium]